ncbi:alpha-amylase [Ceratobasidium sp. AG-Ba]|nr:alpha-amylase [Ceratobasidium sp. AG-Ba]
MHFSGRLLVAATTFVLHISATPITRYHKRAPTTPKKVIAQMFEWTWDSIAAECTSFLGPAGYGYVQVSPPSEHVTGPQWWTDYQPVSYTLTSKRGNRSQFQNMISTCNAAGVNVIADTIFNHMAGSDSGTGVAGSNFRGSDLPVGWPCRSRDRYGVCSKSPGGIRQRLDLSRCYWLRLDAAKHMASGDISNILSRLSKSVYITQEVIFGNGEDVTPAEYTGNGDVQEFRYTSTLQSAFSSNGISSLNGLENFGWVSGGGANVFAANHDTERNGASLNHNSPFNTYTLAMVFSLSYPYGTPTILSSYSFSNIDDGAPNGGAGTCSGSGGSNGWLCQHRWPAVAGMVPWFNAVDGQTLTNWQTGSNQQIAFGRGSVGFVAINNVDSTWSSTFATSLPNGVYCDIIGGAASSSPCTGTSFTVSNGSFSATVPARNAIAIYTGATSSK